ncbi:hypothetical protein Pla22_10690 [Rubripirellula amarantea]|uniref:Transmembrane protein n=1 Tax=Rubripirellula amarantea TaxID=2527999 RepID=A0A5C5WSG7_9BACT|nr:hypothetical protein [Rubripirellula amarantea]TWT53440.1 hypothetical protein Pla22_10690 [Rubripirellula amarantea]
MDNDQPDESEYRLLPSKFDSGGRDPVAYEAKLVHEDNRPEMARPPQYCDGEDVTSGTRPTGNEKLLQSKAVVLGILFLVTGALGIPLLWSNKNFGPTERMFWAITVIVYTLALMVFAGGVCYWSYRQITGA